ncbi:methyltransferase domain-containing protein [Aurantiacibacter sediminis]|uniref:Methyltransferase domain-containing protein n=1 Tax=Aurantiacibacter sediminis TaxID=2793064 RepID=A0ABS0N3V5_9SPHN|nr:methyltransferase domain-containing protein [Aurantiacibacter sediminis]
MSTVPPQIFSKPRKFARTKRADIMLKRCESALFLLEHMAEDVHERLGFVRFEGTEVLLEGFGSHLLEEASWERSMSFARTGWQDFDKPVDQMSGSFDLVASINSLDTVNDLPGALIQMRELLKPGGMAVACFIGGMSLPKLRRAMLAAEPDKPAARMHPLIDPRSCPQLLSRAGWADPVVDSYQLTVRYSAMRTLVQDLRGMAMTGVLASNPPPLSRAGAKRAAEAFAAMADDDGKVSETFEIVTLTGRRSMAAF